MARTPVNAVYYPSWRVYKDKPPSSLQVAALSHIFYAFVLVNEDGSLRSLDEWADTGIAVDGQKGCLAALRELKRRHPHLKIIVSFGGGSGSAQFPKLAESRSARSKFAGEARQFVDKYGFDGVDIDWEHPSNPDQARHYLKLLQALRDKLPSPRYMLTSALPVGEYCLKLIDLRAASKLLDFLNLMGYDFTGPWTSVCGHQSQLQSQPGDPSHVHPNLRQSCALAIDYLTSRRFPAEQILLGIPVYARNFPQARGLGQPFKEAGEMEYADLPCEWIDGASVDRTAGAASYVDGEKGFVSFDVPETVKVKARYVKNRGLGGLFYWTGAGDLPGERSLVRAGFEELMG